MFIYHKNNHEIVAIWKDDTLTLDLDEPYKKTFYSAPPMDINYGFLLFDGKEFSENIQAYKDAQKELIKQQHQDYLLSGYLDIFTNITMDADIVDILKVKSQYELSMSLGMPVSEIRDYYNNTHYLELEKLWNLIKSLGIHYSVALSRKSELQKLIDEKTTSAEILNIEWEFNFDITNYITG